MGALPEYAQDIRKWHSRVLRIAVNEKVGENMKEKEHQSIEWKETWRDEF